MIITIPVAALMTLDQSVAVSSWKTHTRTDGGEVHEAGEGDDPEVPDVDYVATMELGEKLALDT